MVPLVIKDYEDTLNALVNCYACTKPGHMKRDCSTQTQAKTNYSGGQKKEFSCYNCHKRGHMAWDCRQPKKNGGMGTVMTTKMKKICHEMIVHCNKKPMIFVKWTLIIIKVICCIKSTYYSVEWIILISRKEDIICVLQSETETYFGLALIDTGNLV